MPTAEERLAALEDSFLKFGTAVQDHLRAFRDHLEEYARFRDDSLKFYRESKDRMLTALVKIFDSRDAILDELRAIRLGDLPPGEEPGPEGA